MGNIQYVVDETGKPVSAIVPIDEWHAIEQAKDIFEHVYLSGSELLNCFLMPKKFYQT